MEAASAPLQEINTWYPNGDLQSKHREVSDILQRVTGYPMVVLDRQQLLRILYDKVRDKTKVVTGADIEELSV